MHSIIAIVFNTGLTYLSNIELNNTSYNYNNYTQVFIVPVRYL